MLVNVQILVKPNARNDGIFELQSNEKRGEGEVVWGFSLAPQSDNPFNKVKDFMYLSFLLNFLNTDSLG